MKAPFGRPLRVDRPSNEPTAPVLSGHEEIVVIAGRLHAVTSQMDRSLRELRDWLSHFMVRLEPLARIAGSSS